MSSNSASVRIGATLLVLAAIALIWFAAGVRKRVESSHGLDLVPVVAITGVVILLITQAGLMIGSVHLAEQAPEVSWSLYQLSGTLGFESFISTMLGAAAVSGVVFAADRSILPTWLWWTTIAFGSVLVVGGLLEGFDVTPDGRFAIFFAIWTFIAGFTEPTD